MALPEVEVSELAALAARLGAQSFDNLADSIWEYLWSGGEGWRSTGEFLHALSRDVWWSFEQVGEEEERGLYSSAASEIDKVIRKIEHRQSLGGAEPSEMQYLMMAGPAMAAMHRGLPSRDAADRAAHFAAHSGRVYSFDRFLARFHHADETNLGPSGPLFTGDQRERYARFLWDDARRIAPGHFEPR